MITSKPKTKVTFYNGLTTTGGPMIEVAYDKSHILFGLGEVHHPELGLRTGDENFATLFKYQLIGDVPDFYDLKVAGKETDHGRWEHSVAYISHLHLDHSEAMNLLTPEIPLYADPLTAALLPVLNRDGEFLLSAADKPRNYTCPIITTKLNEPIHVGDITLIVVSSDHDTYGAADLIVKMPDKIIVRTGDIRLHGYHPDWVRKFMAAGKGCDVLIIEDTDVSWPERSEDGSEEFKSVKNEIELMQRIVQYQKDNPKRQLTFNTYPTNVGRILRITSDSPRKVVLHAKHAELLKLALKQDVPYYYLPEDGKIDALDPDLEISHQDLLKDDHQYFWQVVGHYDQLQKGGLYIHSNVEPLGGFDPAYAPFIENIKRRRIGLITLRRSEHADAAELKETIAGFEPKISAPVRTSHPELEGNPFGERILPKRGEAFTLS